jgi:LysR family hydrogen peroxide-inducible transcriptional activator
MTSLPTTKQLRYFVALEKHQHFAKAAQACFISQPAFSVAIKELELLLDIQLVDRTNKSVTITNIGKEVATQARLVLRDIEGLVDITQINKEVLSGQLKLGAIPTIAPFLLPKILPKLRKKYPDLKLFLYEDLTERIYQRLMDGELDVILIALPYELRSTEVMKLFRDKFYLATKKGSKLLNSSSQDIEQLPQNSVLLLEDGHCLRDHALSACKIRNINKVSDITASSMLTLVQMVASDLGITYLPEIAIDSYLLKNTQIQTYPMKESIFREVGLVWRKGSHRTVDFKALGNFIISHR